MTTLPAFSRLLDRDLDFFNSFFNIQTEKTNFPKTSIYIDNDDKLTFDFALAGFSKEDISITLENDKLIIKGHNESKQKTVKKVFQNQLAYRDFEVSYRIPNTFSQKTDATFKDGILTVKVEPNESSQPKLIEIK